MNALATSLMFAALLAACSPVTTVGAPELGVDEGCADVIRADAETSFDGTHTFTVTVVSDDRGWDKYADAWILRVTMSRSVAENSPTRTTPNNHLRDRCQE